MKGYRRHNSDGHTIVRSRGGQLSNGLERTIGGVDIFHYSMNSVNQLQSLELIYEREWDGGCHSIYNGLCNGSVDLYVQLQCCCARLCVWVTLLRWPGTHMKFCEFHMSCANQRLIARVPANDIDSESLNHEPNDLFGQVRALWRRHRVHIVSRGLSSRAQCDGTTNASF